MVSQQTSDKSNVSLILSRERSSERHSYQNVVRVNYKSLDKVGLRPSTEDSCKLGKLKVPGSNPVRATKF